MEMQGPAQLRARADALAAQGRYAEAAPLYRQEAALYRKKGDLDAAKVEDQKADRYSSSIVLYAHLTDAPSPPRRILAKHEPAYGCYMGGFIDRDDRLGRGFTSNDQLHRDPSEFARVVGKRPASTFCYLNYGRPFPMGWVNRLKEQGVAPHIAWEPNNGLNDVNYDDYLIRFARDAARAECPIFLRYASEMNGDWTRYSGNPGEYIRKWRTVWDVMRQNAPNVAMMWCVNHIPEKNITAYYPGDQYVDWVGINFYSVPFYNDDLKFPGLRDNPADRIKFVYKTYGPRKPIAVCEYGASRMARVDMADRSAWASKKISELYAALPRVFPRVKMINYFNCNNMQYAAPGRQLNNYSLTDSELVRAAYAAAVRPDYFLEEIGSSAPTPIVPIGKGIRIRPGVLMVSAWARCYADQPAVTYAINGQHVATVTDQGGREVILPLHRPGAYRLTATIKDDRGKPAATTESLVTVG
jgi:hypothetical protein